MGSFELATGVPELKKQPLNVSSVVLSTQVEQAGKLDVPANALAPGLYTCQVNVIDVVAGQFTFPRVLLYVRKSP